MDSDDSQDVSSGNESEVEPVNKTKRDSRNVKRSSSRESVSSAKSSSRSRSNSSNRHSYKSSDSSPQSPTENEPESPGRPRTPKSLASGDELTEERADALGPLSPDNVSLQNPPSVISANSSRSNSPSPNRQTENGIRSPVSNSRDQLSSPNSDDSRSIKSDSSHNSRKSNISSGNSSGSSNKSKLSRNGRKAANLEDGNSSDSSISSTELKHNKNESNQADEISDGEIDLSENEKRQTKNETEKVKELTGNINISHEDLSDVSDLNSNDGSDFDVPIASPIDAASDQAESKSKKTIERTNINEVVEEQLDFEAEDGECAEPEIIKEDKSNEPEAGELEDDTKRVEQVPEELEEGELTDEDEARPEETEPRPVCRFFSRGQCTWGASCRFLHPGVTDKGNYTMFELVRPVVPGDYGNERLMYNRTEPPQVESAWERGLRTAKEMMRKSIKRKEQDIDFEEKKMNLSLAQEELDKENGYYAKAPSPEPSRYMPIRHPAPIDYAPPVRGPPEEYYGRRQVIYEPEYPPAVPRERFRTYRDVQPHRSAEYYNTNKHEEEAIIHKAKKPKREVIVQRVEERAGRGDEWSDPWMRSKSPAGRKRRRKHSYSSGSSYSSSSSSRSSSASSRSSYRSQSRSSHKKRSPRTHKRQVSPSVIVSERKAANERAALMNPPAPRKRAPSPGMMRVGAQNPPAPSKVDQFGRTRSKLAVAAALARVKGRKRTSKSSSGSTTGSSSSDSDSTGSSSSSSRNASPTNRRPSGADLAMALKAKAIDALKSGSEKKQIKLNLKNNAASKKNDLIEMARKGEVGPSRKRLASPPVDPKNSSANKKASSRREELLKQLKAVEDAIAKKRSKV